MKQDKQNVEMLGTDPCYGTDPFKNLIVWKRISILLACACATLLIAIFFYRLSVYHDIYGARDQIFSYHNIRSIALSETNILKSVESLEVLSRPSRPCIVQVIVEMERKRDMVAVINYLRIRTGKNLGDDPIAWLHACTILMIIRKFRTKCTQMHVVM